MLDTKNQRNRSHTPTPNSETLADWIIVLLCIVVLCFFFLNGGL